MPRRSLWSWVALIAIAASARAQSNPSGRPLTSADSVFARARQLVLTGNGAAGRVLVDSMVTVTPPDTPAYADALYWRATLAATSADAERDFRRIVVEYSLSPHTGDALLQLARLEVARGDRAAATTHLERFLLENPNSVDRSRAALLLIRLAFEQNDALLGCTFLGRTLRDVPDSAVELRNQFEYYSPRCASVDTTRSPPAAPVTAIAAPPADSGAAKRDTIGRDSAHSARAPKGRFTLQVAAYASRADADGLAKRLKARGLDVRVVSETKLFRVRVGRYETRAAAAAAAKDLKAKKIVAFVTEAGPGDP